MKNISSRKKKSFGIRFDRERKTLKDMQLCPLADPDLKMGYKALFIFVVSWDILTENMVSY